jgi:hypothetical protein
VKKNGFCTRCAPVATAVCLYVYDCTYAEVNMHVELWICGVVCSDVRMGMLCIHASMHIL